MLDDYLKNLNLDFKNLLLNLCKTNNDIELFLINCSKINLNIFENNKVYKKLILVEKIKNLKEVLIKSFGMKIFKKYSNDENSMENIEKGLKKLKEKISLLDDIYKFISKYSESEFSYIFEEGYDTFKIDYSLKPMEILEFDPSLFITSDDYEMEKTNSMLIYSIKGKDEFIEEYSN